MRYITKKSHPETWKSKDTLVLLILPPTHKYTETTESCLT